MKNRGRIEGNKYIKHVDWNRAVLWKTREISLPPEELAKIYAHRVDEIIFIDKKTNKNHIFKTEVVNKYKKLKKEGQEAQFYWYIDIES